MQISVGNYCGAPVKLVLADAQQNTFGEMIIVPGENTPEHPRLACPEFFVGPRTLGAFGGENPPAPERVLIYLDDAGAPKLEVIKP